MAGFNETELRTAREGLFDLMTLNLMLLRQLLEDVAEPDEPRNFQPTDFPSSA